MGAQTERPRWFHHQSAPSSTRAGLLEAGPDWALRDIAEKEGSSMTSLPSLFSVTNPHS